MSFEVHSNNSNQLKRKRSEDSDLHLVEKKRHISPSPFKLFFEPYADIFNKISGMLSPKSLSQTRKQTNVNANKKPTSSKKRHSISEATSISDPMSEKEEEDELEILPQTNSSRTNSNSSFFGNHTTKLFEPKPLDLSPIKESPSSLRGSSSYSTNNSFNNLFEDLTSPKPKEQHPSIIYNYPKRPIVTYSRKTQGAKYLTKLQNDKNRTSFETFKNEPIVMTSNIKKESIRKEMKKNSLSDSFPEPEEDEWSKPSLSEPTFIDLTTSPIRDDELTTLYTNGAAEKRKRFEEDIKKREDEIKQKIQKLKSITETFKQRELELQKKHQESKKRKEEFTPLTPEEEGFVKEILEEDGDEDEVLADNYNIKILKKDILLLRDGEWLNDEIINFYGNIIIEKSKEVNPPTKIHVFNTFFYKVYSERGFSGVSRWTKRANIDIFALDKLIIPIHVTNHWCLAVIDFKKKEFQYYDSLGGGAACFPNLKKYLKEEYKDKKKSELDLSGWKDYCPKEIPHQQNGYDCGVFMCTYAFYIALNKPFNFSQKNMLYLRKKMILEILSKTK